MNEEKITINKDETIMKSKCPVCNTEDTLHVTNKTDNIPYFGDILETSVYCTKCGYQESDNICLEKKDPIHYTLTITQEKLNTRIAKSQTATITIPELGLKVEPGPKSQGYVSNIEGIITRFEDAIQRALTLETENPEAINNANKILEKINNIKNGNGTATIIIADPFGHSVIDDKQAIKRSLTQEEINELDTGFVMLDE
ncbi:MAG: ZPR1 zinc finger domain-containing protein [Methanobacteriaceae archaeon]|nr:ZPR1 zinc finger domain-containing protein [Methanobacteriaceae archaeon]